MRQIKFRAWDKTVKKMTYDNFSISPKGALSFYWQPVAFNSAHSILMQFTGLTDKTGKDIYEGDIVKCHDHPTGVDSAIGEVYWKDGKWRVTWSTVDLGDYGTSWTEVLGNKYEHPQLLNSEQNVQVSVATKNEPEDDKQK